MYRENLANFSGIRPTSKTETHASISSAVLGAFDDSVKFHFLISGAACALLLILLVLII